MDILKYTLRGLFSGIIFISAFYWSTVLTFISGSMEFFIIILSCALLTNVALGFLLAANSYRHLLLQWLISVLAGVVTFSIYRRIDFLYYWLNRIFPGYGTFSAGGGFAVSFSFFLFCLCFAVAVGIAAFLTKRNVKLKNNKE